MTLRSRFERLNDSKAPSTDYVVIHGWDEFPNSAPKRCLVLCADRDVFAQMFGLHLATKRTKKARLDEFDCEFTLVRKGEGLFAETFESEIIARRTLVNGCVYVPSPDHHAMALVALAVRNDIGMIEQPAPNRIVRTFLNQRVGIGRQLRVYDFSVTNQGPRRS